jgi:hypothetical protein
MKSSITLGHLKGYNFLCFLKEGFPSGTVCNLHLIIKKQCRSRFFAKLVQYNGEKRMFC